MIRGLSCDLVRIGGWVWVWRYCGWFAGGFFIIVVWVSLVFWIGVVRCGADASLFEFFVVEVLWCVVC